MYKLESKNHSKITNIGFKIIIATDFILKIIDITPK